jgi:hypothetical protein
MVDPSGRRGSCSPPNLAGVTADPMIDVSLDAVIVAVTDDEPRLLVVDDEPGALLPSGPLDLVGDSTLELGMRRLVCERTGLEVGYAEQLYTFGDLGRLGNDPTTRPISVAYLALVEETSPLPGASWIGIYDLLPWEDHRDGEPAMLADELRQQLDHLVTSDEQRERVQVAFGPPWDGIRVVERYELLYEADLVAEHAVDRGRTPVDDVGRSMQLDHRRIAAVALARLRGKLTYRPVVFELLPERFTLLELQRTVEALAGVRLHKQNFRRLVERSRLVEGTGERVDSRGGRPAELFRYRSAVLIERPRPGVGQPYH